MTAAMRAVGLSNRRDGEPPQQGGGQGEHEQRLPPHPGFERQAHPTERLQDDVVAWRRVRMERQPVEEIGPAPRDEVVRHGLVGPGAPTQRQEPPPEHRDGDASDGDGGDERRGAASWGRWNGGRRRSSLPENAIGRRGGFGGPVEDGGHLGPEPGRPRARRRRSAFAQRDAGPRIAGRHVADLHAPRHGAPGQRVVVAVPADQRGHPPAPQDPGQLERVVVFPKHPGSVDVVALIPPLGPERAGQRGARLVGGSEPGALGGEHEPDGRDPAPAVERSGPGRRRAPPAPAEPARGASAGAGHPDVLPDHQVEHDPGQEGGRHRRPGAGLEAAPQRTTASARSRRSTSVLARLPEKSSCAIESSVVHQAPWPQSPTSRPSAPASSRGSGRWWAAPRRTLSARSPKRPMAGKRKPVMVAWPTRSPLDGRGGRRQADQAADGPRPCDAQPVRSCPRTVARPGRHPPPGPAP